MAFIEEDFFHDKRRNLTVYEKHSVNFIRMQSWWHLLKVSSSTIRERTWPFTKNTLHILLACSFDAFIEENLFQEKRANLTVYEKHILDFNDT
jgi:hypothetical protein